MEERAAQAAADFTADSTVKKGVSFEGNRSLGNVVSTMLAVNTAVDVLHRKTQGKRFAAAAVLAASKKPEKRKSVHTIQIGSGDNIQTITWTEVEGPGSEM